MSYDVGEAMKALENEAEVKSEGMKLRGAKIK